MAKASRVFVLLAVLAGAVACAGRGPGPATEPFLAQPAVEPDGGTRPPGPLAAYGLDDEDNLTIVRAFEAIVHRCMAGKGFRYRVEDVSSLRPPPPGPVEPELLGLVSASAAGRTGYHRPSVAAPAATADPHHADYNLALRGWAGQPPARVPIDRGCHGQAERELTPDGTPRPESDVRNDLARRAAVAARADSRVRAAFHGWAACMSRHGYPYATPVEASAAAWPSPPTRLELETAGADMRCKREAKLLGTWYAVRDAYERELIERHPAELRRLDDHAEARLARARAALAGQ